MKTIIRFILTCIALCFPLTCASGVKHRSDPLLETIVRTADQKTISPDALHAALENADVIYLSEKHDNPRQHELQLLIIQELLRRGKKPAIGFEFFSREQTGYLMHYTRGKPSPFEHGEHGGEAFLRRQLDWDTQPDEDWKFYYAIIALAKQHRLTAFGTDLPASIKMRLTRYGANKLTGIERRSLSPTGFSNPAYEQLMKQKFTASHCGWSEPNLLERLYQTWVARNDAMARSIVDMLEEQGGPVVMIVGGGHVEHNMGIVERTASLRPQTRQVNLGLTEIAVQPTPLSDYIDRQTVQGVVFGPVHDYLWFTRRVDYDDPCEQYRKMLKRKDMHGKKPGSHENPHEKKPGPNENPHEKKPGPNENPHEKKPGSHEKTPEKKHEPGK